jgi:hypothetical protein
MTPQLENGKFKREGVRKMRLMLVDETPTVEMRGGEEENVISVRSRYNTLEIGTAEVEQGANGGLIIDLFMAGQWTDPTMMAESLHMKGFIRAEMRKD